MSRLLIASNRLPITVAQQDDKLHYHPSAGGLATGLRSLEGMFERIWIGWPGQSVYDTAAQQLIAARLATEGMVPVFLTKLDIKLYYEGFSNKTIWPHFHYFSQHTEYNDRYWDAYVRVNQQFAAAILQVLQPGDRVWVHDYQLLLVPGMLRQLRPELPIAFFLHIPFPSYEVFRTLPQRTQLLEGMLGADQIGFHTFGYMRHFLSSVYRILGIEQHFGKLDVEGRLVNVDAFPMGIDYDRFAHPPGDALLQDEAQFILAYAERRTTILSIDRLDYTKGIPQRVEAFGRFLAEYPDYHGKATLVLIVVPSRDNVEEYKGLKVQIDELVGRINGQYSSFRWLPIRYYYRAFSFEQLCAIYRAATIALVTPLRDGMNLVAKEYIASKEQTRRGVLILSEMAGAANELTEALLVNPNDPNALVRAIKTAMDMPPDEQARRLEDMQRRLRHYDVRHWAETFMREFQATILFQQAKQAQLLADDLRQQLVDAYARAESRLLLLDYDGTLVNFATDPKMAYPDADLLALLRALARQPGTQVVLVSGRDKYTLGQWFKGVNVDLAAEHGVWIWHAPTWSLNEAVSDGWKAAVLPILKNLVDRTPGSFVEEKDYTVAWHYRKIDREMGVNRVREIRDGLIYLISNHNLQVLEGNKVVEIRNAGVDKGHAAQRWLNRQRWPFVLAIGDDRTDEDLFQAMPPHAYTAKVGVMRTSARYRLRNPEDVRALLQALVAAPSPPH